MSVLFIDIDGCCLPVRNDDPYREGGWSAGAFDILRHAKADGYRLILHSSWRHLPELTARAEAAFAAAGVPLDGCVDVDEPSKARAIVRWLDEQHADEWPDRILIVDDDALEFPIASARHIRPDFRVGLTLADWHGVPDSAGAPDVAR